MKKIAIYCVNYNSYSLLQTFVESVKTAVATTARQVDVHLFVADNTENNPQVIQISQIDGISIRVFPYHQNLGYFGAIRKMMEEADPSMYDYTIISNVDLTMQADALLVLAEKQYPQNTGWIAPQIYSEYEKRDKNPRIPHRYKKLKLQALRFVFSQPLLYKLQKKVYLIRKRRSAKKMAEKENHNTTERVASTYAGHGSFIILTSDYFKRCGIINYPVFLFCEEIYLAENCRTNNLIVIHDKSIKITDSEHESTGKVNIRQLCRYNHDAVSYILKTYY